MGHSHQSGKGKIMDIQVCIPDAVYTVDEVFGLITLAHNLPRGCPPFHSELFKTVYALLLAGV
jgi:hypothetical protein